MLPQGAALLYVVSWIYFLLGEVEAESRPRMADGSLELSEGRMRSMEPRQSLTNTSHVENLDFFKSGPEALRK